MTAVQELRKLAILGNHLPRQCGIATFTTDLGDAIAAERPALDSFVVAMNDAGRRHAYDERVRFEIDELDLAAYRRAADFLNVNTVDVLSVQHEYGIFGGKAGGHVLTLLRELRMPIVTTLHTILAEPNPLQREVMDELTRLSERVVVMSAHGAQLLHAVHGVPQEKIDLIPHGIATLPDGATKDQVGVLGKRVILTFGLLSPDKGIEHVIDAMPAILARFPDAIYIVLGATHPHVVERHGETYRLGLEARAHRLGVDASIIFHDRFVSPAELAEFLAAADIYVTPYLNLEQITSGTLAYAVGSGRAVISTPYRYAQELLADERGLLVPRADAPAIAREVIGLFAEPARADAMRARAAAYGTAMRWPAVAAAHLASLTRARDDHAERRRTSFQARTLAARPVELPALDFAHVRLLTDDTGMLQHGDYSVPRYAEGYCLDDNARALLLMTLVEDAGAGDCQLVRRLASRYAAFVAHAFDHATGRFRNFMSYARRWTEAVGSEDSHGRAVWALGTVVGRSWDPGRHSLGGKLFHAALPAVGGFSSPRAWAYALLGIAEYQRSFQGDRFVEEVQQQLAQRLLELFQRASSSDWPWFEDRVTYCNARLAQAMLVSGDRLANEEMSAVGVRALAWLVGVQCSDDSYFVPIGSDGFYRRGDVKAPFDQQPVEACGMVSACLDARQITGDVRWAHDARRAFDWFLGQNQLQLPLYDAATGGCRDGLHADRVNQNQGAESTLSFLLALTEMRAADRIGARRLSIVRGA
ncbi:MAG: glycosyltransferase family 4 protein [Deltaproteobacteria bacterium]|nr:glycosyltransferase family 4 protein [Deltaproteobacteria bacterium]